MNNHYNQALRFIDTTYMAPELIRHLSVCRNLNRQLWQEDNNSVSAQSDGSISSGFYSGDDEMETSPTKVKPEIPMETSPIKVKPEIPKITFEIERPECTSVSDQSDESISSGFYSGDDEMETSPTKVKPEIPKITFEIERPECTSNN